MRVGRLVTTLGAALIVSLPGGVLSDAVLVSCLAP